MKSPITLIMLISIAATLIAAAPAHKFIPLGKYDEGLVIPASSPVKFRRFGPYDRARFSGRFIVEGTWVLDCNFCEPGEKDNQLHLSLVPDPPMAARLPHWKMHDNDIAIDIVRAQRFISSVSSADERRMLLSGKLDEIRGHAALLVDEFEAGLDCDSANYSARFVAVAKAPTRKKLELAGDYGCGGI